MQQSLLEKRQVSPLQSCHFLEEPVIGVDSELQGNVLKAVCNISKKNKLNQDEPFQEIQENCFAKLSKKRRKNIWNQEETQKLVRLHDQLGNKWSSISKRFPGKTENDVKNRFFSQLRRGLRHLNKAVQKLKMEKNQQIKPSVLYKIIASCEDQFKSESNLPSDLRDLAKQLKLGIFNFLAKNEKYKSKEVFQLIQKMKTFISLKNPHIKPKKRGVSENQPIAASDQSFSQQQQELGPKKQSFCKIQQMNTIEDSQNELAIKEPASEQLQTKDDDKFIEKPPICLNDPFDQLNSWIAMQEENSWCIDQDLDKQPYIGFCYPEFVFPTNNPSL